MATASEHNDNSIEYRGYKLSLVQTKDDWCAFIIPPGDQAELLLAEDRKAVLAKAQGLIDRRLADKRPQ